MIRLVTTGLDTNFLNQLPKAKNMVASGNLATVTVKPCNILIKIYQPKLCIF